VGKALKVLFLRMIFEVDIKSLKNFDGRQGEEDMFPRVSMWAEVELADERSLLDTTERSVSGG